MQRKTKDSPQAIELRRSRALERKRVAAATAPHLLSGDGYMRLQQVLAVVSVSASTWWSGVSSGRYPQPTRALGERITAWRVEDIRALIEATAPRPSP